MVSAPFLVALEIARVSSEGAFMCTFGHARAVYHSSSIGATQKSVRKMRSNGFLMESNRQGLLEEPDTDVLTCEAFLAIQTPVMIVDVPPAIEISLSMARMKDLVKGGSSTVRPWTQPSSSRGERRPSVRS